MTDNLDDNGLLKLVRDYRRRGESYFDIERKLGINAERAESLMSDYLKERAKGGNLEEARYLQLERFEMMIGPLMDKVEMGDVKAADTLIKLLNGINETIGIAKEQKSIEITIINQQQGEAVFKMIHFMMRQMLTMIQSVIADQDLLGEIEDRWDPLVLESMGKAREQITETQAVEL